jgi:hypothetical protein
MHRVGLLRAVLGASVPRLPLRVTRRRGVGSGPLFAAEAAAPWGTSKTSRMYMALSMFEASVPSMLRQLVALDAILEKAAAHAAERELDPAVLLATRLSPDMFALTRQVQLACDFAKNAVARLAGHEPPNWPDEEMTFDQLRTRIAKTIEFVNSFPPSQLEGAETRDITLSPRRSYSMTALGGKPTTFKGGRFLLNFELPNFYFHATIAYAILRHCGVELGKRDFMGLF